ncbi:hypothetical protein ABPG72_005756 [Tetrahymena utriculariae]
MSDSSFLNSSNIQKLNKELNDLKSRKVLTDMLNQQIDVNEHLSQENSTLIMNQRKLLNLIQSKDRIIEDIKSGTLSFCDQGQDDGGGDHNASTYRQIQIQLYQNKAQLMADHQQQIILQKTLQGGLQLKIVYEKHALQNKFSFFERLKELQSRIQKQQIYSQVELKSQQNQILRLYSLFKVLLSLIYKKKKTGFAALCCFYIKQNSQEIFQNEQIKIIQQMQIEYKKNNDPLIIYKQFYDLLKQNKNAQKSTKSKGKNQNNKISQAQSLNKLTFVVSNNSQKLQKQDNQAAAFMKTVQKLKQCNKYQNFSKRLKAVIIQQKDRILELLQQSNSSQEQVQDFIKKTQIIVNTIQNDFNIKCKEIEQLNQEKIYLQQTHQQEIDSLEEQLQDIRQQREESLSNLQEKQDIQSKYQQKCMQVEELKDQNQKNSRELQVQIDAYEQKFNQFQAIHDEVVCQLQEVQVAYNQKCAENTQILEDRDKQQQEAEEFILKLQNQLQERHNEGEEDKSLIQQQLKIQQEKYEQKCKQLDEISEQSQKQKKEQDDFIMRLQKELKQYKISDEECKQQLSQYEQKIEVLKKEFLQNKQFIKEFEFQKEESQLEIETLTKKIQQLQAEKNNLVNNLEISVANLKDLKQQNDHINSLLIKNKEEKSFLFQELEDKENMIIQLNEKIIESEKRIKDANRRASHSPNMQNERDEAIKKFNKVKKEKEDLQLQLEETSQKLQKTKQINQELTKEAIELNKEKLQMSEEFDNLCLQLQDRESKIAAIEDKFQILLQKLDEKEIQLQKQAVKPELLQKITQDKLELEEENRGLKKELLDIDHQIQQYQINQKKLQQEIHEYKQKEIEQKEQINEINQNLANLTRDKIGYLRENSEKQHEIQKMKQENQNLKSMCDQYQTLIEDYNDQFELFTKTIKSMDSKIKNLENRSQNTMMEAMGEFKQNQELQNSQASKSSNQNHQQNKQGSMQLENIDLTNMNAGQQLIKKIDQMKNMYSKQN